MDIAKLQAHRQRLLATILCLAAGVPVLTAQGREAPKGYQQILPRGSIAAIDNPSYVPAAEADIRSDAWVLGVVIGGQARAYSLDLLNAHEVVNDSIGGTNFAAVW
jgi:hypothetical protein